MSVLSLETPVPLLLTLSFSLVDPAVDAAVVANVEEFPRVLSLKRALDMPAPVALLRLLTNALPVPREDLTKHAVEALEARPLFFTMK